MPKPSLGFADDQDVGEEEEVSVLVLHPRPELDVSMKEEGASKASEEGLDQGAAVWTDGELEALPGGGAGAEITIKTERT